MGSWNDVEYVANFPRNNVAGAAGAAGAGNAGAGPNIVENIVENVNEAPMNYGYNINAVRYQVQQERQRLRNRSRGTNRRRLLNSHVGRPNQNNTIEDEARAMGLTDENIADIRGEIVRMRNADPNLVARQVANNALAREIMNESNNNNVDPNQMGGKRRRRRSSKKSRKTRKSRKQRKTRARKH